MAQQATQVGDVTCVPTETDDSVVVDADDVVDDVMMIG